MSVVLIFNFGTADETTCYVFCRATFKGSICLLYKSADTAFCVCEAVQLHLLFSFAAAIRRSSSSQQFTAAIRRSNSHLHKFRITAIHNFKWVIPQYKLYRIEYQSVLFTDGVFSAFSR